MSTKIIQPYQLLVNRLACDFEHATEIAARDLGDISNSELALVIHQDDYVALDAFSADRYAEILDSAISLTEEAKAMALWRGLRTACMREALEKLARDITERLSQPVTRDFGVASELFI